MRMHMKFVRRKGVGAGKVLGTDGAPGVVPSSTVPAQSSDNVLISPFANTSGSAVMRIAVGYVGPAAAIALSANLWLYDSLNETWFEQGAAINITPNRLTYFDVAALCEPSTVYENRPGSGSIIAALVVQDGVTPDGEYIFSMGACLSV